jgi:aspartate racemase
MALACNTAHLLYPDLISYTSAYFPSLIDLVSIQALKNKYQRVGILASPITIKTRLYQNSLDKLGIKSVTPDNNIIDYLETVIRNVIRGENINRFKLFNIGNKFIRDNNLDGLIIGCTELPLVFPKNKFPQNQILDSLDILADTLINYVKC